jgi:hypothetical protein
MNEEKDTGAQPSPQVPARENVGEKDGARAGSEELTSFFNNLGIHPESIAVYRTKLAALGLTNMAGLRNHASVSFLQEQIGIQPGHVNTIMRKLYDIDESDVLELGSHSPRAARSVPPISSFLSKENVLILRQIGHGSSGRVFMALFVPTLTLIAIKDIEIKGAIEQRLVAQELKSIYRVALCDNIGQDVHHESVVTDSTAFTASPGALNVRAAHSPYVIGFYGAVSQIILAHATSSRLCGLIAFVSLFLITLLPLP